MRRKTRVKKGNSQKLKHKHIGRAQKRTHKLNRKIRGGTNKKFVKKQCAPKEKKMNKYSCYSDTALIKMRDLWNARHKDTPIQSDDSREIWNNLKQKMESACDSEACWLKQKFMENNLDNDLLNYTFAPKSPPKWKENHNTWLNSVDIEKVMKQYEHTYPCFRFIGPTPIDFDAHTYDKTCVWDDLCNFEIADFMKKGVNKIGIIFNTDPHTKSGAHWISLFINLKKKFVFFFDSNGTPMPKEIVKFTDRIIEQARKQGVILKLDSNTPFAHQEGNTECGMYSLYMLITLLKDKHTYKFFKTTKISDDAMENLRDKYFNVNDD
jgi:hypothetical protein